MHIHPHRLAERKCASPGKLMEIGRGAREKA
jgi:hypothetical protein